VHGVRVKEFDGLGRVARVRRPTGLPSLSVFIFKGQNLFQWSTRICLPTETSRL
jgi:hypothetical protein